MTNSSRRNAQTWPYKRHKIFDDQLRKSNTHWFADRGLVVNPRKSYLLADWEDWPKIIILPEVAKYIDAEQKRRIEQDRGFPLHKYIHHGLSSQAMIFNLIGPLIIQNDLTSLQKAFQSANIPWPKGQICLLYTSDAADEEDSVDLGGRRI